MAGPCARELWEMPEIVDQILIRVPPDEPGCLIRASLACKLWCRILSGRAFRSSYRTLHKTPPILGFLRNWGDVKGFIPTTIFRLRNRPHRITFVLDCRHRRVLVEQYPGPGLSEEEEEEDDDDDDDVDYLKMVVWDPVSGSRTKLHDPDVFDPAVHDNFYSAAVLCAADGCNHDACNLGPFFVAFICINTNNDPFVDDEAKRLVSASIYSSKTRQWSSPTHLGVGRRGSYIPRSPGVVAGKALYVLLHRGVECTYTVLRYDLVSGSLSHIDLPGPSYSEPLLILGDDGGPRVVELDEHSVFHVWSMEVTLDGLVSWIQLREVDLKMLLPIRNPGWSDLSELVGCVEGINIIIAATDLGVFTIGLNSLRLRKPLSKYKDTLQVENIQSLFLYASFSNPPGVVAEPEASEAGNGDAKV